MGGTRDTPDRDDEAYNILVGKIEGGKHHWKTCV